MVEGPYPDPGADDARFVAVDVAPLYRFERPVTLSEVKADPRFAEWELVRLSRLSVMPVKDDLWDLLHEMGGGVGS